MLEELPAATTVAYDNVIRKKAYGTLILCFGDRVLREITKETTATGIWKKLETLYMTKSLANRLYLKKKLYTFQMHPDKSQSEYIDEFHKQVDDLAAIDIAISDEDQAFLLLTSLPSYYNNLKMTEAKGDGGERLYVKRRSSQRDMEQGTYSAWSKSQEKSSRLGCYICQSEEHLKRDCPRYNHKKPQCCVRIEDHVSGSGADGYDTVNAMMAMRNAVYEGQGSSTYEGWVKFRVGQRQSGKIKVIKGSLGVLSGTRRANCVYTLDGQAMTKTLKVIQQQNGLVKKTNVTLLDKVRYFLIQSGLSKVFWAEDTTMSTYLVNRSPSSAIRFKTPADMLGFLVGLLVLSKGCLNRLRNMGFNESEEYKKTFIGSGVGTGSVQVLQGVEFEVKPQKDHTFDVEPYGNVDHVVGLKDDMDARSDVYALSNSCKKYSDDIDVYNWEYTLGFTMKSLSGDCDVEKNGKWSCIYAIGSQEYQMVRTRLDIASADVGMLDKFDRGLQTDVQVFMDFDYAMGRSITSGVHDTYGGCKGGYLAKGTRNRVRIRAKDSSGYCYRCLVKGDPWSEVPAQVKVATYRY
ncbi:zinc finger, CCHC-type containing protein [Tanacetum coccineum]